jgi:1-deoxy-D-xylulose-5-phosphate reductoisomerase
MSKKVVLFGSTGSIGTSALDVISRQDKHLRAWGLSANTNWRLLAEQAERFKPEFISISDDDAVRKYRREYPESAGLLVSQAEFRSRAVEEADIGLVAVVGAAGLEPSLAVAGSGKRLALANKESLVMAGGLVMAAAEKSGCQIIPVDSEHSALFQALEGGRRAEVSRILITASGGPFLDRPATQMEHVTLEEALSHPTWSMGKKITIDSATMVNKAFEVIEARWLFDMPPDRISVVIHPESIIHSLVEFRDRSVLAQMSMPDMRLPIQYALTYPERLESTVKALDLAGIGGLTFRAPDPEKFPCLAVGFAVAREGGTLGAVFNAANEVAVDAFMKGRLPFGGIHRVISQTIDKHDNRQAGTLDDILEADRWARTEAQKCL